MPEKCSWLGKCAVCDPGDYIQLWIEFLRHSRNTGAKRHLWRCYSDLHSAAEESEG